MGAGDGAAIALQGAFLLVLDVSQAVRHRSLPAFNASRPGSFTMRLTTPAGKAYYLKVKVAKKKSSRESVKPVAASKPKT